MSSSRSAAITFLVTTLLVLGIQPVTAQPSLVRYPSNPILTTGLSNSWDSQLITSPFVLQQGSLYRMWYVGFNLSATDNSRYGSIGYAYSNDGISWTKNSSNPVLTGASGVWDASLEASSVYFNGSMYLMWYTGTANGVQEQRKIGLAFSPDGIVWTKYSGNPVLNSTPWASSVWAPWVVNVNKTFLMFFTGFSNTPNGHGLRYWSIGQAQSTNGINWTVNPDPILTPGVGSWDSANLFRPAVNYANNTWQMWYTGQPLNSSIPSNPIQIGYATSPNGVTWYKSADNPTTKTNDTSSWDNGGVGFASVSTQGAIVKMWFTGWHQGAPLFPPGQGSQIGYSRTPFPITFQTRGIWFGIGLVNFHFNGTLYWQNNQIGVYNYGNYTASVSPLVEPCAVDCPFAFSNWTTTGNVSVANAFQTPTVVTVSGPGSLTANYVPVPGGSISPISSILATLVVTGVVFIVRLRIKHSKGFG